MLINEVLRIHIGLIVNGECAFKLDCFSFAKVYVLFYYILTFLFFI